MLTSSIKKFLLWPILSVLIFASLRVLPQSNCRKDRWETGFYLIINSPGDRKSYFNNLALQDVAYANNDLPEYSFIMLDYAFRFSTDRCSSSAVELNVGFFKVGCHPLDYKGFNINDAIRPSEVQVDFYVYDQLDMLHDSISLKIPLENSEIVQPFVYAYPKGMRDLDVRFKKVDFFLNERSYEWFRNYLASVDHYFSAISLVDELLSWTDSDYFNFRIPMPEVFIRMSETRRILSKLKASSFIEDLGIRSYDPGNLLYKIDILEKKMGRYDVVFRFELSNELRRPLSGTVTTWAGQYLDVLDLYYAAGKMNSERFGSYGEEAGRLGLTNGYLNGFYNRLKEVGVNYGYSPEKLGLARAFYNSFVYRARMKHSMGDAAISSVYFDNADELEELVPGLYFDRGKEQKHNLSREALLSYLEVAKKAAQQGNTQLSQKYFHTARAEVERTGGNPELNAILEEYKWSMLINYLERGIGSLKAGQYETALSFLKLVKDDCDDGQVDPCPAKIDSLLQEAFSGLYNQRLAAAEKALEKKNTGKAADDLKMAVEARTSANGQIAIDPRERSVAMQVEKHQNLDYYEEGVRMFRVREFDLALYYLNKAAEQGYGLERPGDTMLSHYRRLAARPVIIKKLYLCKKELVDGNFREAEDLVKQCVDMTWFYGLSEDDYIREQIVVLQEESHKVKCRYALDTYQNLVALADSAKSSGKYITGLGMVQEALQTARDFPECSVPDLDAWQMKVDLEPLVDYQLKYESVMGYLPDDYYSFRSSYIELGEYFRINSLEKFGASYIPLEEWVMSCQDLNLLKFMLDGYNDAGEPARALTMIRLLKQKGAGSESLSAGMAETARRLASIDHQKDPSAKPMDLLDGYCPKDNWYKSFRKSYKKEWMNLDGFKIKHLSLFLKK